VIAGGLVWHILHPRSDSTAGSLPPTKLQPDMKNKATPA
jgi:hypothetical protein